MNIHTKITKIICFVKKIRPDCLVQMLWLCRRLEANVPEVARAAIAIAAPVHLEAQLLHTTKIHVENISDENVLFCLSYVLR